MDNKISTRYNDNNHNTNHLVKDIFKYLLSYLFVVSTSSVGFSYLIFFLVKYTSYFMYPILFVFILGLVLRVCAKWFLPNEYVKTKIFLTYLSDTIFLSFAIINSLLLGYTSLLIQSFVFAFAVAGIFFFIGNKINIQINNLDLAIRSLFTMMIFSTFFDMFSIFGIIWFKIVRILCNLLLVTLVLTKFGAKVRLAQEKNVLLDDWQKISLAINVFDHIFRFALDLIRLTLSISKYHNKNK